MSGFKGKLNIYTCHACHGHVVTKDLDGGVTPFTITCRSTVGCKGLMQSSMYQVFDQSMKPDLVWYRPGADEVVPESLRQHVARGGLILGPAVRVA